MRHVDERGTRATVEEILNRRPAVGFAVGIVRGGSLEFFHPHGFADVASGTPVDADTVFRVASITKTFTAIAVMQLWERGLVDLDAPVNDHLRAYRLVPADPRWRPATVRHLLTHTAGIGEQVPRSGMLRRDFGESFSTDRRVPSLAEYYGGELRLDAEPGTMFRYGDHGPSTLGQVVEDLTGTSLDRYLRRHVFDPLGMADTTLVRSEVDPPRLATGYKLSSRGIRAVADREWVTAGATNAWSTPKDMGRYLAALLGGGGNEFGAVLEPATLASMFAPQYQPHPRIPGIGLAFWRRTCGDHLVVEHQGTMPGFDSQILAVPDSGVGVVAFTNGTRQGALWLPAEMGKLLGDLLGAPSEVIRTDVPQRPDIWSDLCGWYSLPGALTDARVRAFIGAGVEVLVRDGQLVLRFLTPIPTLYRGFRLHPADEADPYVFDIDFSEFGLATFPVVFSRDSSTGTMAVHFDLMPVSALKQPPRSNPRRWVEGGVGAAAAVSVLRRSLRRRRRRRSTR
jgi:CubicO group peptidase (beta-lactamase class C family)